jgi:ferredoxin
MAYKITEECISCGACEPECQNESISEGEEIYVIDPDKCAECVGNFESPKCFKVCPVDSCVPDPEHVESQEELLTKWHRLHSRRNSGIHLNYKTEVNNAKI